MHVTYLGHAQLFINAANQTLLVDPWFEEPVFGGAWFRYPPPPYPTAASLPRPSALLLSHIHPDHSGPGTLAQLSSLTPTYALPFKSGALKRRLDRAKYSQVHWASAWETFELAPGVKVTFVPHDRGWEVSSIVIEAEGVRLYHGNDNPLSLEAYKKIRSQLGPIDIAFLPFAGASSYPTGFDGDEATLKTRCAQKKAEGIKRFTEGLEGLQPADAAPFASSWALLEESELWKNYVDRPTPAEALAAAMPVAQASGSRLLMLEPGDEWTREAGVLRKNMTRGWSYDAESVRRYATQERARVKAALQTARAPHRRGSDAALDAAVVEYFGEMTRATQASTSDLKMTAGFVAEGTPLSWTIEFEPGRPPSVQRGSAGVADETLLLPADELWSLVTGPANWEDVWYGYRLRVQKRPGAGYYRAFWEMLLNYDEDALSERLFDKYATTPSRTTP